MKFASQIIKGKFYIIVLSVIPTMTIEIDTKNSGNSTDNNVLKEMFGKEKFEKSLKEMVKEFRRDFESKWLK